MEMPIDDIKHCLKAMNDREVCEECRLYGTTGTDHCEHDCVDGALNIIEKYKKIEQIADKCNLKILPKEAMSTFMKDVLEVLEDGDDTITS